MSIVTARLWLKLRHQEDKGLRGARVGSGPPEGANRPYDWAKDTTDLYKRTVQWTYMYASLSIKGEGAL
jgi:hypothetical protein